MESSIFILGLWTSLLLLFSLTSFPCSPLALLKRQERCASYSQKAAGRGSWQRVRTFSARFEWTTTLGQRLSQGSELRHAEMRQQSNGDNPVATLHCTVSSEPAYPRQSTNTYMNMITPHRRHVLPSWVVGERPATRYPRPCMLTTKRPTQRQTQARVF